MRARLDHRAPGPDGTLGVVLMRLRIAEKNPDIVAHAAPNALLRAVSDLPEDELRAALVRLVASVGVGDRQAAGATQPTRQVDHPRRSRAAHRR